MVNMYPVSYGGAGSSVYGQPLISPPVAASQQLHDPNNDVTCWSEHLSPDGKKYWFNKATAVSTYDKPLVLKTPEERAIAPCAWKEYVAEGRVYYSNGHEST
jgi:pre-mRNA-processing factor 40